MKLLPQALSEFFRFYRCHCDEYSFLLILYAVIDMILCVTTTGYIIVNPLSTESWKEENKILASVINGYTVSMCVVGVINLRIMACKIGLQIVISILARLFGIVLLFTLHFDPSSELKLVIWPVIWFSLTSVVIHIWFAIAHYKDLGSPAGLISSSEDQISTVAHIAVRLFLPAVLISIASGCVARFIADNDFKLHNFAMYVVGLELILASAYFCTIYDKISAIARNGCDFRYRELMESGKQYAVIYDLREGKKIPAATAV